MARSVQSLAVGKVIGDVVDMFTPTVELVVYYGSMKITNGCKLKPFAVSDKPLVQINTRSHNLSSNLYTLVMTDPDAPTPSEPSMREWLHWIVVDIPEGLDSSKGREVVAYMEPRPPIGIHRYVFTLFLQKGPMVFGGPVLMSSSGGGAIVLGNNEDGVGNNEEDQQVPSRIHFNTRNFAAQNGFDLPAAAVFFYAQKEPASKKR
ncbi:Phosphatidylethanolamine-binding protein PEBP [Macleaya cordata]|uniref:Phosphatidylethanolamine-binding protein PEBP n=1 Tax=Macleaya cordata TaxID=56857 RepID=A0A200Q8H1_MACCD|nr:Phosphatidylethanolamine-binding protein PEBP [Macleaya cordata]